MRKEWNADIKTNLTTYGQKSPMQSVFS